jgi:putative transposase
MLAALLRPIFNADDRERARVGRQRLDRFRTPVRKEAALLEGAEKARSLLPFPGLPRRHSLSLRSANLLERIHREIRKCTDVFGIFPKDRALIASSPASSSR